MKWQVEVSAQVGELDLHAKLWGDARPIVLVGPNGAGKTSLLRTLVGAWTPKRGRIRLGERVLLDADQGINLPPEQRRIGYVPQGYGLFPHLNAVDNVAFGLRFSSDPAHADRESRRTVAMGMLDKLSCRHLAHRDADALSGGERQRVALARALVVEPELLLLDEPLSALDAASRRGVRSFLVEHLAVAGRPAIVVTHDLRDVRALGAEVFVLEAGRIIQRGTTQVLQSEPASEFVAELFDSPARATPSPTS